MDEERRGGEERSLIEDVSLINGAYFARSRRNPKIINFRGTLTSTAPPPLLDDFYFSISREREREIDALFMRDFVSSFVHDPRINIYIYIAWFCRKKFRQLDSIEEKW